MPTPAPSAQAATADRNLRRHHDLDLPTWLAERRAVRRYYPELADELLELTGVEVTAETVRRWADHYGVEVAA